MPRRNLKIPTEFSLLGHTIKVRDGDTGKVNGWWEHEKKKITLHPRLRYAARSIRGETFCHELAHCLLDHIGRQKLSADEDLVEALGEALYHALSTFSYRRPVAARQRKKRRNSTKR